MTYFKCKWKHDSKDEPVLLLSELDDERWELRKIEVFRDGRIGWAGPGTEESSTTRLGEVATPALAEIAADPQFEPSEITKEEFES
jgi:hypothetical protein